VNIHPENATTLDKLLTKAKWVLVGTLAPVLVVFVAWSQRQEANRISATLTKFFKEKEEANPENKRRYEWTTMHGFYAMMGCFVLRTDNPGEQPYIPGSPTLHLQHDSLKVLAQMDLLPDISQDYIKDKSKADTLAKTVVICQASWLVLQCIARWSVKLPVTALELNVLAHTTSALFIYLLWWEKPMDIQEPTVVDGDRELLRPLTAALFAGDIPEEKNAYESTKSVFGRLFRDRKSYSSTYHAFWRVIRGYDTRNSFSKISWLNMPISKLAVIQTTADELRSINPTTFRWDPKDRWEQLCDDDAVITPFMDLSSGVCCLANFVPMTMRDNNMGKQSKWEEIRDLTVIGNPTWTMLRIHDGPPASLEDNVISTWWSLFRLCIKDYLEVFGHLRLELRKSWLTCHSILPSASDENAHIDVYSMSFGMRLNLITPRVRNFSRKIWFERGGLGSSLLVLGACVVLYGGIHAIAWNDHFPTTLELLLWRSSSVYIPLYTILMMVTFGTHLHFGSLGDMTTAYYRKQRRVHPRLLPLFRLTVGSLFAVETFLM